MHNFTKLLKKELICALGCTEPIALALASSKAREILNKEPEKVLIKCSGNIIKNVKGVIVPNTNGMKGVEAACAMGIVAGDSSKNLEVISNVKEDDIIKAKKLVESGKIEVVLKEGVENLDIEIILTDEEGNTSEVEIKNKHTNIIKIKKNGQSIISEEEYDKNSSEYLYKDLNINSIFEYSNTVNLEEIKSVILNQLSLNENIAKEGLKNKWGASIGKMLLLEEDSLRSKAKSYAAAGSDARMSGCSMPVVVNAGSGNQGITCSMPVLVYARDKNKSEEDLIRAVILSNLVALHIKSYIGRLSAFCGVTSAGVAAGAGIAYLETKNLDILKNTITNAILIVSGMICDGAKPSCAAKIASAVDAGITGFNMAKGGNNFNDGDGLHKGDVEKTIKAIGRVAKDGMRQTDLEILNIMIEK